MYFLPGTNLGPKTGRQYGAVVAVLRPRVRAAVRFTADDVCAGLNRNTVQTLLAQMAATGELRLVRPGKPGHTAGGSAIYEMPENCDPRPESFAGQNTELCATARRRAVRRNKIRRRYQATANHAANLTSAGQPRVRAVYQRYTDLDALLPKARAVARVDRYRQRLYAAGLNQRGQVPGRPGRRRKVTATDLLYAALRRDMGTIKAPEFLSVAGRGF